ncbi:Complement C1q-like protein 4 [Mizuhopecten yessoensis]|uniref:Complement C1q-like protein 4 n=1 Tax=Mizuhopecten yessoensis TaxID=6573 RepID=A0A210QMH4_MIZYE|nr:Complement C1q-like protein 4 [Mizuhopecten yessoensis]
MASVHTLQLVCLCVVAVLVTCDTDITQEVLSTLNKQVQTLQAAFQSQQDHIHKQDGTIVLLKNRIQELEAETHELKRNGAELSNVGFSASLSTTTALGDSQIVVFDTVVTNDGNGYDTRHGHFTAPVAGLYAFSVTVMCYGDESEIHAAIVRDGQKIGVVFANGNHFDNGSKLVVVRLQAGQMVWVEHTYDPSGNKINGAGYSSFSGFLIRAY